jgi:hypothetical protein
MQDPERGCCYSYEDPEKKIYEWMRHPWVLTMAVK